LNSVLETFRCTLVATTKVADLYAQLFLRLMNNGENRVLGVVAVCFGLKQLFSHRSAIDAIDRNAQN